MHRPLLLLLTAMPAIAAGAQSTADTTRLVPMVTSATRTPLDIERVPATVTVLQGDDLRARGVTSLAEALRDVPGVAMAQSGSFGATTSIFVRGGQSTYTKVLLDGVPINMAGGGVDVGQLTLDNVERVEVVRGPASVIWGSDAATGVINVITRRGAGAQRVEAMARAGTAGAREVEASASGSLQAGGYSVGLSRTATDGIYEFNSGYANTGATARVDVRPSDRTDLAIGARYTDYATRYPTDYTGAVVDRNAVRTERRAALTVEAGRRVGDLTDLRVVVASATTDGGADDAPDGPARSAWSASVDHVTRRGAELRARVAPATGVTATVGIHAEEQAQRSQSQSSSGFNSRFAANRVNRAAYGEVVALRGAATLTAGLRLDDNQRFGQFITSRLAMAWQPLGGTRLRASAGSAFREPSFFENFATGFVRGNPSLDPEQVRSWEVAAHQQLLDQRLGVGIVYFDQRFTDLIDYNGGAAAPAPSYTNIARASASGTEIEAAALPLASLRLSASATVLRTSVDRRGHSASPTAILVEGQRLLRRPGLTWSAAAAWTHRSGIVADARVTRTGDRDDRRYTADAPYTASVTLPAYATVDASILVPVRRVDAQGRSLSLTGRATNLGDTRYQGISGFDAPGRTLLAGVRATF
jgi:vitamin B12 transporter